jgi:hypothetical protein
MLPVSGKLLYCSRLPPQAGPQRAHNNLDCVALPCQYSLCVLCCRYANFSLGTAAELAAILVAAALVDRAGRHNCISGGLLLGGVACLAGAQWAGLGSAAFTLAAIGKFGCSGMCVCGI